MVNATTAREYAKTRAALAPVKVRKPFVGVPMVMVVSK